MKIFWHGMPALVFVNILHTSLSQVAFVGPPNQGKINALPRFHVVLKY